MGIRKFVDQLFTERFKNGWQMKEGRGSYTMTILTGEYTGTWSIVRADGITKVRYSADLATCVRAKGKLVHLFKWRCDYIEHRSTKYKHPNFDFVAPTRIWYIISQMAGIGWEMMQKHLEAEPRRVMDSHILMKTLGQLKSHKDRVKFAKKYVETWSVKKSLPKWAKRVPAPKNLDYNLDEVPWYPTNWMEEPGLSSMLARWGRGYRIKVTVTREIIKAAIGHKSAEALHYRDMLEIVHRMINDPEILQAIPDGREILATWEKQRWVHLFNMDQRIQVAYREFLSRMITEGESKAEAKHREFNHPLPPGVRQLITKQDFIDEGKLMEHCVASYFGKTDSWYFNTGNATLQVTRKGCIVQHRGLHNSKISSEEAAIGYEIAKMLTD